MLSREKAHRPIQIYSGVRAIHPQRQNKLYIHLFSNEILLSGEVISEVE